MTRSNRDRERELLFFDCEMHTDHCLWVGEGINAYTAKDAAEKFCEGVSSGASDDGFCFKDGRTVVIHVSDGEGRWRFEATPARATTLSFEIVQKHENTDDKEQ